MAKFNILYRRRPVDSTGGTQGNHIIEANSEREAILKLRAKYSDQEVQVIQVRPM